MSRNLIATISRHALKHNLQTVKTFAPHARIIAMVKANAYGHGLQEVCKTLQNADAFGVASLEEAILIREIGLKNPVVLMEGFFKESEIASIERFCFTCVVHSDYQIKILEKYPGTYRIPFWIKINTGMNRLGLPFEKVNDAFDRLISKKNLHFLGFMGHFPQADDISNPITLTQYQKFADYLKKYPGFRSLANSATIMQWPACHHDWVRPGLMLYGASPFSMRSAQELNLLPAMELRSEIIAIQQVKKGEQVGYGGTWVGKDSSHTIAIVAVGYGDGYPWHAQNGTPILVQEKEALLCGRVSMDMIAIDITNIPAAIGESVTLWGGKLPIERIAQHAKTVPWELFCRLTERVKFTWVDQ
ncbi:MAG TPA: alanine racemase [Gammaproteobacteria bacterium]|nr:alanine racemase [Gammaproteobacteria bacterium]